MGIWDTVKSVFGNGESNRIDLLLKEFQEGINYPFNDPGLLQVALTHRSFAKSGDKEWLPSNERLEFLGDSILSLIVTEFLYVTYPNKLEGGLTKLRSLLVNETTLHRRASEFELGKYILLSSEEDKAGGRHRASIISDAFEAVIGAIYLDGGLAAAKPFIHRYILTHVKEIAADETFRNFKGELLEHLQAKGEGMPRYEIASEEGPDHHKTFTVDVFNNGDKIGCGTGSSKKDAEQKAAAQALHKIESK
ncbi:MAG: ribonuclease III [candidate division Zixibacteria bacterium]|nr:ribonuclease III [candidate division Zixibacteria bacterium]